MFKQMHLNKCVKPAQTAPLGVTSDHFTMNAFMANTGNIILISPSSIAMCDSNKYHGLLFGKII